MRYELMLPHQIGDAIKRSLPVVLPLGVLEYHGPHLGVGLDTIVVAKLLERLEAEREIVLLPPFHYGAASYAVAAPEAKGSVQVDGDRLYPFARDLFTSLLKIGFRNIHFVVHHQTENFAAGMPTDLAFKFGARQAIFAFLEETRGAGWWGRPEMADYYARHAAGDDPFNWIKAHPLMTPDIIAQFPFDHAGEGETSLLMALCPEAVEMERLQDGPWFTETARNASAEKGEAACALILDHLRRAFA